MGETYVFSKKQSLDKCYFLLVSYKNLQVYVTCIAQWIKLCIFSSACYNITCIRVSLKIFKDSNAWLTAWCCWIYCCCVLVVDQTRPETVLTAGSWVCFYIHHLLWVILLHSCHHVLCITPLFRCIMYIH